MTTRQKLLIAIPLIIAVGLVIGLLVRSHIGAIRIPGSEDQPVTTNAAGELVQFLKVPDGFKATYFAKEVPGARVMLWDSRGRMLVSQTDEGTISLLEDNDNDGAAESATTIKSGLNHPHGMVFECNPVRNPECYLYVAEANKLSRYTYDPQGPSLEQPEKLLDFTYSSTDRHKTRSLAFFNEHTLLISVGSTCNVCVEQSSQHGKILSYDTNTGAVSDFATGLRNAVFLALSPVTGELWMTEMGRDGLGDDTPPDEINRYNPSRSSGTRMTPNFGWPICYGKNIHDTDFDKKTYIRNPCMGPFETPSFIDIPAHSAPLGLTFIPEEGWPESEWYDLLVAYHGSWNRSVPTGYKVVRMKLDAKGVYSGIEDFITGWLSQDGKKYGRPADIMAMPGGVIYISDDEAGVIYKISRVSE